MTAPLRIEATDPEVIARTAEALALSGDLKPGLVIRCGGKDGRCSRPLAHVGHTRRGVLFTASWRVPIPSDEVIDGTRPTRRESERRLADVAEIEGELDHDERHAAISLLTMPGSMNTDFPALLIRCNDHGDAVLDRRAVLERLRDGGSWLVTVGLPSLDYAEPSIDWSAEGAPSEQRQQTRIARFRWEGP